MLDDDIVTVPAGWYPDPMGLPQLRWWDNYAWTEFTSAARTPLIAQEEPKLAYADDDFPSRRSQRDQRVETEGGGARRAADKSADLASTLRQLEPPKPQNIERDQPAPAFSSPAGAPSGQAQGEQQRQEPAASDPSGFDPFAEFLAEPSSTHQQRPEWSGYPERTGYSDSPQQANPSTGASGFTQPQQAPQYAGQQGYDQNQFGREQYAHEQYAQEQYAQEQYGHDQNGNPAYGYGQSRIGVHAPLAYTPFVWIIAMIPLIQLVGILLVVSAVDVAMALPFLLGIAIGPYIATIPLATADRSQMLRMGHRQPAHWAWSILTAPGYLVARAIAASREHGKGLTPLLVWAALSLLQVASVIAVPGILISAMPAVFSAEVEQSIEADSIVAGRALTVDCPATPPVQIGGTFNCTGVTATNESVGIVVRLQRANGWIDWRVYGMVWENSTPEVSMPTPEVPATPAEPVAP